MHPSAQLRAPFAVHARNQHAVDPYHQETDADLLNPPMWELLSLGMLLLVYVGTMMLLDENHYGLVNTVGPLVLTGILLLGAYRMSQINTMALWMGLLWYRVSTAVYFGFGSMAHELFDEFTRAILLAFFRPLPIHFLKLNITITLGTLTTLVVARVLSVVRRGRPLAKPEMMRDPLLLGCAIFFCIIGYGVKFFISVPASLELTSLALPAALNSLSLLSTVGLFLLTLWGVRYDGRYLIPAVLLLASEFAIGVVLFNKSEVLKALIVFLLAFLQKSASGWRLAVSGAAVLATFLTLVPVVDYGRLTLVKRYENITTAPLGERARIVEDFLNGDRLDWGTDQRVSGLARFAYGTSATPAIAAYDAGRDGDTLSMLAYVFIPRALWADKPIFDIGARYNQMVNMSANSSSWMGILAEGYWNMGWFGVVLFGLICGLCLYGSGVMALDILGHNKWLHFPVVLFGLYMGVRTDGSLVLEIIVSFVICLIVQALATWGDGLLRPFMERRRGAPSVSPVG